jgi:hypothetical protein
MKARRGLRALACLGFASAAVAVAWSAPPSVEPVKKGALITIAAHLDLKAAPAKVWAAAASAEGFCTLTGFKPDAPDKARSFAKLGDSIGASIWSDTGRLVVTAVVPGKELRVTWEPANASYLCAKRIVIAAAATGTSFDYWDRYTDDQPNADETAKRVRDESAKALEAFRISVEK